MNKAQWQEIKDLFHQADGLPNGQRDDWVKSQSSSTEVYAKVMAMLAEEDDPQATPITNIVNANAQDLIATEQGLAPGDHIEQFSVLNILGEGGMGSVYLAERADGEFEQKVAIKVIHQHKITPNLELRFKQERQILAELNHKNISGLIGGGVSDQGLHYIIMEYVDGVPITDYCQEQALDLEGRLSLFKQVLSAIKFAHQNLIVHRDIKPSNVIVTANGDVKLLDFGIAKLLHHDSQANVNETQVQDHAYSHTCAAPEQILKQTITTQTDVYGLGALLMQILTGDNLFELQGKTNHDVETLILEKTPDKPSNKCRKSAHQQNRQLANKVKGDLDTIVLKALSKEPENRYVSAAQFAEDIDRYLNHYPIIAKPQSRRDTLVKFVQRNTLSSGLATAFVISLIAGSAVVFYQSIQIEQERNRALAQASIARQTTDYLTTMFKAADPNLNDGEVFTAKMLVDQANASLAQLDASDDIKVELLTVIASVYTQIGDYEEAQSLHEQAQKLLSKSSAQSINTQRMKVLLQHEVGDLHTIEGRYDQAIEVFTQQLADLRSLEEAEIPLGLDIEHYVIKAHFNLATALSYSGQDEPSLTHYKMAITLTKGSDEEAEFLAASYFAYGHTLRSLTRFEESRENLLEGIRIAKFYDEKPTLDLAHGMNQLASTLISLNDLDGALEYALEGLAIRQNIHQSEHIEIVSSMGNVANVYAHQGKLDQAIEMRKQSLSQLERTLGKTHPFYGVVTQVIGRLLLMNNQLDKAEQYLLEAEDLLRVAFPDGNKLNAEPLTHLGHLYLIKNQNSDAYEALSRAVTMFKQHVSEGHHLLASAQLFYQIAAMRNGASKEQVQPKLEDALATFANTYAPGSKQYDKLVKSMNRLLNH